MVSNNVDEEDEDVLIQGNPLHDHLSKLGYTDFESVSVSKATHLKQKQYFNIDIINAVKNICMNLSSFYSCIIQEKVISKMQLAVISSAHSLLDDHSFMIKEILTNYNDNPKKIMVQELIAGIILILSIYISYNHTLLPTLFISLVICCIGYIKYLRYRANRDLKNIISLQNELLDACREAHKILQRDYKIKFLCFLGDKLHHLQFLMETLVKFMGNISNVYYECSLSIAKFLPLDNFDDNLFTKFECNPFKLSDGEIDCQTLKKLYHTYLLVQSEMLYLLAIAYNSDTWTYSSQNIPEIKLARIIRKLNNKLVVYKPKLLEAINLYRTCEMQPTRCKIQNVAKWHDPTVQLELASHKLQSAYKQIFSIFEDIEKRVTCEIDDESSKMLTQRLNEAFKEIDVAKNLVEFVILWMTRSRLNLKKEQPINNEITINQNSDIPVIINSDPEIIDEVFEEYIKDEPSNLLYKETDEYSLEQYKLDKLLTKNFMRELKEALIDKHKSMSERESKALQRIYKNISQGYTLNNQSGTCEDCQFIPRPPPMPSYYIWSILSDSKSDNCSKKKYNGSEEENVSMGANIFNTSSSEDCEDKNRKSLSFLPSMLRESQATQLFMKLPPAFLREDTFVGDGENSDDENAERASENNKGDKEP